MKQLKEGISIFDNDKPYMEESHIRELEKILKENIYSNYPFNLQITAEHGKTHWLSLSAYDLIAIIDGIRDTRS